MKTLYDDTNKHLIISILLEMTSKYPYWMGIHLFRKDGVSNEELMEKDTIQIITRWFESLPKSISELFEFWINDLSIVINEKRVDVARAGDVSSFSLGDLSKSFAAPTDGKWTWAKLLPKSNLSLFGAIPITWKKRSSTLKRWLAQYQR